MKRPLSSEKIESDLNHEMNEVDKAHKYKQCSEFDPMFEYNQCSESDCSDQETIEPSHWNCLYRYNDENGVYSEYLLSFKTLESFLDKYLDSPDAKVLVPGCGDSPFSADMQKAFELNDVTNCDVSAAAIDLMQKKYKLIPELKWVIDDLQDSEFEDDEFDIVVDKSLIDCLFWVPIKEGYPDVLVAGVLENYHRILKDGGTCIILSTRDTISLRPFYDDSQKHPTGTLFADHRESGLTFPPCKWDCVKVYHIGVSIEENMCVSQAAIPTDVTSLDPGTDPEGMKRFYMFILKKS